MPITNEITVIIAFAGYHAFEASAFIDGRENLCRCRRVLAQLSFYALSRRPHERLLKIRPLDCTYF